MTRYNLGLYYKLKENAYSWMQDRLRLFRQYTVPSMKNQTCKDYIWIIIYDKSTPIEQQLEISELVPNNYFISSDWPETKFHERKAELGDWKKKFVEYIQDKSEYAIMTRLDNDDTININFVKNVQNALLPYQDRDNIIVDFLEGCFYEEQTGKCFLCNHTTGSPFISFVTKVTPTMDTVYRTSHREMCIHLKNRPLYVKCKHTNQIAWCEVIHGKNISNCVIPSMVYSEFNWNELKGQFGQ